MNLKISFTAITGILIAVIIFSVIMNWYPSNFDPTYTWTEHIKNESDKPLVLLFGSSHTGVLNTDYIQEYLKNNELEHEVYNLAIASDYPTRRAETIGYINEINPEIVLYGIDMRMFEGQPSTNQERLTALQITKIRNVLPDANEFFNYITFPLTDNEFFSKIPKSPKIVTLQTVKHFIRNSNQTITLDVNSNRPFFNIEKNIEPIKDLGVIKNDWEKKNAQFHGLNPENNREFDTLKNLIKEMKNGDDKVIVFATPNSRVFLDWVDTKEKIIFEQMFREIESLGATTYPKHDTYADDNIWSNLDHIVEDKPGIIYSEDVAKMIISEIKK